MCIYMYTYIYIYIYLVTGPIWFQPGPSKLKNWRNWFGIEKLKRSSSGLKNWKIENQVSKIEKLKNWRFFNLHVQYWSCGPGLKLFNPLVQYWSWSSILKIWFNIEPALRKIFNFWIFRYRTHVFVASTMCLCYVLSCHGVWQRWSTHKQTCMHNLAIGRMWGGS